ncbi:hypothetical protein PM082_006292 [Marasmius tenuissimus]|nr:hypothetical protein PM082_006292 [Marasmius tenuissimus]
MQLTQQKLDYADAKELWVDSTRGEICRGPEGPKSDIKWNRWFFEMENLPLTSELLQEDVFMRFLASQKSKEADRAFVRAIGDHVDCDVNVPESCHRPTIFSTLTATPIAFANNVWTGRKGFVERKVLEDGLTRFRLDKDAEGWFWLWLNEDVEEAWLFQSSNIFQSRGISLEDDLGVYKLVYPRVYGSGHLDETPSTSQRRRQQPIYLFIRPPPRNPLDDDTLRLHFWSFHENGQHRLSPESCRNFGLPLELDFFHRKIYSKSWSTSSYQLIRRYHTLRSFDPTTPDFARHLGFDDHIFQPIHHSDRFTEVDQEHFNNLDGSVIGDDSEFPSHTIDQKLAEDPVCMASNQAGRESAISSICATNKHRKMDMGFGGAERNNPEPELRHQNDTADDRDLAIDGQASRPCNRFPPGFFPLQTQSTSIPRIILIHAQGTNRRSLHPATIEINRRITIPLTPQAPCREMCCPLRVSRGWPNLSQNTATATYYDALPPSNAYSSAEIANSASDPTASTMNSNYTPPSAYPGGNAIANAPRYDVGADQNTGWSGLSHVEISTPANMIYNAPSYPPTYYLIPAVTYSSESVLPFDFTYPPHSAAPMPHVHDPVYPSPFSSYVRRSLVPQQHWNPPVVHHDPSYTTPSFSPLGVTHYPPNSTIHPQAHLPLPAYAAQGNFPMLPSNGGGSHVPHQTWSTPVDHSQQYTYDPPMQSTQLLSWNETSGESEEGSGTSGW